MNQSVAEVVFKVNLIINENDQKHLYVTIFPIDLQVQARTRFGEDIRVSGNVPALGCNDPSRAVELVTSPGDFPWWQTKSGMSATSCLNTLYLCTTVPKINR
jgi:hypothetical protein